MHKIEKTYTASTVARYNFKRKAINLKQHNEVTQSTNPSLNVKLETKILIYCI